MDVLKTYYWDVFAKNYANFSGRATRTQYWLFALFNFIVSLILMFIWIFWRDLGSFLFSVFTLGLFLPSLAITVRRLHDISLSGWWIIISVIPFIGGLVIFVLTLLPSTQGENRFGK